MIVHCYCGQQYYSETTVVCVNPECSEYGIPVTNHGDPSVEELVNALDFIEAMESFAASE